MLPQQQPRYQQSALFAHNPYVGNFQLWQKQGKLSCETMRNARDVMKSNPYIGYVHHGGRGIGDLLWEEEKTKPVVTHVEIAKKERWKARHLTRTMLQMLPLGVFNEGSKIIFSDSTANRFVKETACAICKTAFEPREAVRLLPCGHLFHHACVDRWLLGSRTAPEIFTNCCPLCKCTVKVTSGIPDSAFQALGNEMWAAANDRPLLSMKKTKMPTPLATSPSSLSQQKKKKKKMSTTVMNHARTAERSHLDEIEISIFVSAACG